ncbi:MAG: efflux RND transporter periplasmic adaptor subunit [Gammaproteobacteria bacterium]|nr:efflux RND transporter periplasmic adaptor subunit [Gammaproteobacteria bacterium]
MKPILLPLVIALSLTACGSGDQQANQVSQNPSIKTLQTVAVGQSSSANQQSFDGSLEAVNQAVISAQTSGRVIALPVDVDSTVHTGDILLRLSPVSSTAQLNQMEANIKSASARAVDAENTYKRFQEVFQKKLIAAAQMDHVTADRDAAYAQLNAAKAARDQANEQLSYTVVRAPFSGVITSRTVQMGEIVQAGQSLMNIQSSGELRAVVDVPEQVAVMIRQHPVATVILPTGQKVSTTSVTIFPTADQTSHTFRIRVQLPDANSLALHSGVLVKVLFDVGAVNKLSIPISALVWRGEVAGVYVLDQKNISFRAVLPSDPTPDGQVEILSGLNSGEKVALDGSAATAVLSATGATP